MTERHLLGCRCCKLICIAWPHRYKNEVGQQKILFRGSFGTQKPGGARKNAFDIFMKNAANTSIHLWGGRLLALFEAGQPYAMDPYTLETLGTDLLGGAVRPGAAFDFGSVTNSLTGALPMKFLEVIFTMFLPAPAFSNWHMHLMHEQCRFRGEHLAPCRLACTCLAMCCSSNSCAS